MFVKCRIQNYSGELPSGVKDSLQPGGVRCAEEEVTQIHTQTQTHKHPFRHSHNTHTHTLPTNIDYHTVEVLKTVSYCVTVFSLD